MIFRVSIIALYLALAAGCASLTQRILDSGIAGAGWGNSPAETPAEPSGEASIPGAPPSDPAPHPAAPEVTPAGLKLKDGLPDWSDARWQDAVLIDGIYFFAEQQQLPLPDNPGKTETKNER